MLALSFFGLPKKGPRIAVTAVVDPAFNTSRRVRFFILYPLSGNRLLSQERGGFEVLAAFRVRWAEWL